MNDNKRVLYKEYKIFLGIMLLFVAMAFIFDTPTDIINGLGRILTESGQLITDFMEVGGLGASILNSAIAGLYGVIVLYLMRAKPGGAALMCLWMTVGWTFWGATVLSILPLTLGVWLYSRYKKTPFSDYVVAALLCHAIAPMVGVFYFPHESVMQQLGINLPLIASIPIGVLVGLMIGFILPIILATMVRVHEGFTLYNMGVAGGMIAVFLAALLGIAAIRIPAQEMWYQDRQLEVAIFVYLISIVLVLLGIIQGKMEQTSPFSNLKNLVAHSGHAPNDFYTLFSHATYINMGLLGIIGTTWALIFGFSLNGGIFACVFSMVAFGALGKNIRNVIPIMTGATICAYLHAYLHSLFNENVANFTIIEPRSYALAILFSTCLAPIAGKFGIIWGLVAGFLHVLILIHVGPITGGLNLYNNGFTSGFVALILVPIILALQKKKPEENK